MEEESYLSLDHKLLIRRLIHSAILTTIVAIIVCKSTKNGLVASFIATCFITSMFVVIFVFCDIALRLCATLVDAIDKQEDESFLSTVGQRFTFNIASAVTAIISTLLCLGLTFVVRKYPLNYSWDFGPLMCVLSMTFSFLLLRVTNLAEWEAILSPQGSVLDIMRGLDYGTGLAYSYYYGYLRLVLPATGTATKGIIEKMENYEDNHNVTFPVHKLFILIPSSAYIPSNLKEVSKEWIDNARELEEERRDRAGNIGRTYRNNVYKIYPGGRKSGSSPKHVVMEGATPLLTFHEVLKHSHPESIVYKRYKSDIILMFYKKLREILQNEPETKDLCELIYYDDYDANGTKVNIAKIILERISEIGSSV